MDSHFPQRHPLNRDSKSGLANAEKSTDTREIINRYCKLGITRSILRCADGVAMRSCTDTEHRPIRISRIGSRYYST